MTNITILTFVANYLPGYKSGGPVRTIANMVDHLGDELNFRIMTLDRDALDTMPYPDVEINAWNQLGKAKVYYASPQSLTLGKISQLIRQTPHDVLYLNSFFNVRFTTLPLLARRLKQLPRKPVVLAPRGQFSAGALGLKSWKKRPYVALSRVLGLHEDIIWQASSEHEVADIRLAIGNCASDIIVAPNLPPAAPAKSSKTQNFASEPGAPLRIVFLSRITPKKNLDYALQVLTKVTVPVEFTIYGGIFEEAHWKHCQKLMQNLPNNIKVKYAGSLPHEQVHEALAQHALFFLPTRGENFGHVINEALASGLPVLISNKTPWRELQKKGIGWDLSLQEPEEFARIIELVFRMEKNDLLKIQKNAVSYSSSLIHRSKALSKNRLLFNHAVKKA